MQTMTANAPRHPWFASFDVDPEAALDAVLRGAAYVPPYQRASPAQTVEGLFGNLPPDSPEWPALDQALRAWLERVRHQTDEQIQRSGGVASFIAETGEALRLVWRLDLSQSAEWLRTGLVDLRGWAEPLMLDDAAYDLPRALLAAAAQIQTSRAWTHLWLDECRRAATPRLYPRIDTLLTGLARLPPVDGAIAGLNPELLLGMALWGRDLPEQDFKAKQVFLRRWRNIKASFPRSGEQWRTEWRDLFKDTQFDRPFVQWLKEAEPSLCLPAKPRKEPLLPHCESVINGFETELAKEGLSQSLWGRMSSLVKQTERYAEITGNSHYLVRSCTRLAGLIQEVAPGQAVTLTRLALTWNRYHAHTWSVRARSLELLDRPDLAEATLWEGLRNAPQEAALYNQLAMRLADLGRRGEAETLLKAAVAIAPDNLPGINELARVLWGNGKAAAAIALLEEAVARRRDTAPLYLLGCLLLAEDRRPEAERIVAHYRQIFGNSGQIAGLAERVARGAVAEQRNHLMEPRLRASRQPTVAWDRPELEREEAEAQSLAGVRALTEADRLFRVGDPDSTRRARATVAKALATDAADRYAHVVKALGDPPYRVELAERLDSRFGNEVSLHLAATGPETPASGWEGLLRRFPQDAPLILLTRTGHTGTDPDDRLKTWVAEESPADEAWAPFVRRTLNRFFADESLPPAIAPSMLARDGILRRVEVGWGLAPH